jgi:hypothetical protein
MEEKLHQIEKWRREAEGASVDAHVSFSCD